MFPSLYHKKGPGKFESRLYNPSPLKNIMTNFFVRRFSVWLVHKKAGGKLSWATQHPPCIQQYPTDMLSLTHWAGQWPGGRGTERDHSVKLQLSFHFWFNIWVERWMHVCELKQERIVWLYKAVSKNAKIYLGCSNFELLEAICK